MRQAKQEVLSFHLLIKSVGIYEKL